MKTAALIAYTAVAALSMPSVVQGHGYMILPKTTIAVSGDPTRYAAEIHGPNALTVPAGGSFSNTPSINIKSFTEAFKNGPYKSVKELVEKNAPSAGQCGITKMGTAQPIPDHVEWSGFVGSHVGPCEVWCDNTRVFQEDNCAGKYTQRPAVLPIDTASCTGAKQLKFIWLALHSVEWQVYINCAALQSGGGGGGATPSPAPVPAATTRAPTAAPAPVPAATTRAPTAAPAPVPAATTRAPAPTPTAAPTTSRTPAPSPPKTQSPRPTVMPTAPATNKPATTSTPPPKPPAPVTTKPAANTGNDADPDCEEDLPTRGEPDCVDDLPVPSSNTKTKTKTNEYNGESDHIGFDALQRLSTYKPGKAAATPAN